MRPPQLQPAHQFAGLSEADDQYQLNLRNMMFEKGQGQGRGKSAAVPAEGQEQGSGGSCGVFIPRERELLLLKDLLLIFQVKTVKLN